jgi:hypothetical protein
MTNFNLLQQNEKPLQTTNGYQTTSSKYTHVNSLELCKQFQDLGFDYIGTSSALSRSPEKDGFQRHLMAFTRDDLVLSDGERMQILCLNSHDGSSSLRFNLGIFRHACANGIVSGESIHEQRIIHLGNIEKQIQESIKFIASQADNVKATLRQMQAQEITLEQSQDLLRFASDLRLSSVKNLDRVALDTIDQIRRKEDKGQDIWTVFNRVQEAVIKGGIDYTIKLEKRDPITSEIITSFSDRTTREIKQAKRQIELNKALYNKALEYVS